MSQKQLIKVPIESEMQKSYLDYAMSVIISRALPDVRDGLKPVHRRILFSMSKLGLTPGEPFRKSATIVGDVIGKYHPHGDSAIYDSLVRMAQDFNLRYPLVEGHGNFGSIDGDPAAAYRYTEARMTDVSIEMLADLDKNTVEFKDNYDASLSEPEVLPSRLPNLLINGSTGIAVGMATNIPPHNLKEVLQALIKLIEKPDIETEKLLDIVKGPDFPTGGIIMGDRKCREAYKTGRSSITIRAKITEEKKGKKTALIITEIPYQVNKTRLIEQIADGIKTGKITHISDLRDESDRTGMRIVIELSANANSDLVINQLYKYSSLQISYGIIMLALVNREPKLLTLREILEYYLKHRNEVVRRKAIFELKQATDRAHILEGLIKAIDLIDEIIRIIKNSKDKKIASSSLCKTFDFSPAQSKAILEMQLQTLTGLHKNRLIKELESLRKIIAQLEKLLGSDQEIMLHIKKELIEISKKYGDERKTIISESKAEVFTVQDLIHQENTIITLAENTFLKRQSMPQNAAIHNLPEINAEEIICKTTNHHSILMFSNLGKVYRIKAYDIPETQKNGRGTAPINIAPLAPGEKILSIFAAHDFKEKFFFTFITKSGYIKKSSLSEYEALKKTKMSAIKLEEGDEVISVSPAGSNETFDFLAVSSKGFCSLFHTNVLSESSQKAKGTRFMKLDKDDFIKIIISDFSGKELVLITENGFGSRISIHQFRLSQKTGKKIEVIKFKKDSGGVAAAILAEKNDTAIIQSAGGTSTAIQIKDLPTSGRNRSGELLLKLPAYDKISSLKLIE